MACFPLFLDITEKNCLVAGGGTVACRKAESLLSFGAVVHVVSRSVTDELRALPVIVAQRAVSAADVQGMTLVYDATGDPKAEKLLADACRREGIPFNSGTDREDSTFSSPAVFRTGDLVAAVSTGGASPLAAQWVRDQIAGLLPDRFSDILTQMKGLRQTAKDRIPMQEERQAFFRDCLDASLQKGEPLSPEELEVFLAKRG